MDFNSQTRNGGVKVKEFVVTSSGSAHHLGGLAIDDTGVVVFPIINRYLIVNVCEGPKGKIVLRSDRGDLSYTSDYFFQHQRDFFPYCASLLEFFGIKDGIVISSYFLFNLDEAFHSAPFFVALTKALACYLDQEVNLLDVAQAVDPEGGKFLFGLSMVANSDDKGAFVRFDGEVVDDFELDFLTNFVILPNFSNFMLLQTNCRDVLLRLKIKDLKGLKVVLDHAKEKLEDEFRSKLGPAYPVGSFLITDEKKWWERVLKKR